MEIFPAIDLRGGKVVRLRQGDPNAQTVFSDDPALTAQRWVSQGAGWLHIVNLDGALQGGRGQAAAGRKTQAFPAHPPPAPCHLPPAT